MKCATLVIIAVSCIFNSISAHRILSTILSRVDNRLNNAVPSDPCSGDHRRDFENALTAFSTDLFKRAATISGNHFVISPHSIWLSLAVIAEGADKTIQSEYFRVLNLPKEFCVRKEYYRSALDLETSGSDVKLLRKRVMIFGNDLQLNAKWVDFVRSMKLLELTTAAKNASLSKTNSHTGKSLLLDTLDYEGLWTTAFPEADIKRSPFYDDDGKHIGDIELMRIKMKVRMAHLPISKVKVLELPVGKNGTYTMLITMGLGNVKVSRLLELYQSSFIVQILNKLIMSIIPIDIAIPKFTVHTKYDARKILEDIGLKSIWFDPAATRYISEPAPIPGKFMQQVRVKFDSAGINPPPRTEPRSILSGMHEIVSNTATGLASAVGRDFIANKPFIYTLIDKKTSTILFTGAFSKTED